MLIQLRTFTLEKGHVDTFVEKMREPHPVDAFDGMMERTILSFTRKKSEDEIVMMLRWRSKEDWMNWERSDVHLAGHREKKEKPSFIKQVEVKMYEAETMYSG